MKKGSTFKKILLIIGVLAAIAAAAYAVYKYLTPEENEDFDDIFEDDFDDTFDEEEEETTIEVAKDTVVAPVAEEMAKVADEDAFAE